MIDLSARLLAALALIAATACAPTAPIETLPEVGPTSPQYAPGDPCRGVVPQLCPR